MGHLRPEDVARIRSNHGSAYTEPFNLIADEICPLEVERSLDSFAKDVLLSVTEAAADLSEQPEDLTLREIAHALCGRRDVDTGEPSLGQPGPIAVTFVALLCARIRWPHRGGNPEAAAGHEHAFIRRPHQDPSASSRTLRVRIPCAR